MAVSPTYGKGTDAATYTNDVSTYYDMIFKVARQIFRGINTTDYLDTFDKGMVQNGKTIEEAVVKLAASQAFNAAGNNLLARQDPDIAVRYYKTWTKKSFKTSVSDEEIRSVLIGGNSPMSLAGEIVNSLYEGDRQERYEDTRGLIAWGATQNIFVKVGEDIAADNYKGILGAVKDTVSGMKFVNDEFNSGGVRRATFESDIVVLMPYKIKNAMDVNELAAVFNLDKAEIKNKIIDIDSGNNIYILDKNAILRYTRLNEMRDFYNAENLVMNYYLHTERLYAISPLFDGAYITTTPAA